MRTPSKIDNLMPLLHNQGATGIYNGNRSLPHPLSEPIDTAYEKKNLSKKFFQRNLPPGLEDLLTKLIASAGKQHFLVFKNNKYITIPTGKIAFFYVKYESSILMTLDHQEYSLHYSLDQIQDLVTDTQFYRLNRQFLVNFDSIKEAEHYFARKLLVNLTIPVPEKLIVSKEKASDFLQWLENR